MKKIYPKLTAVLLTALIISTSQEIKAQLICPAGGQTVFNVATVNSSGQPVYVLYMKNFVPNARITLFQTGQLPLEGGFTDASGNGKVVYNANTYQPEQVESCTSAGCCRADVPPINVCPNNSTILHVKYPANLTDETPLNDEPLCAIYIQNSIPQSNVLLFDAFQNVIPTVSNASVVTDLAGFVCYIYPCDALPVTIAACGAAGCCSKLVPAESALPIKLSSFAVKLLGTTAQLNWVSSTEIGSRKYIVEKSSDGRNFTAIGEVGAAGNTTFKKSYSFDDKNFVNGIAFYRLKQVDIDDKFEYSKVVYVNTRNDQGIITRVFPNPFKTDIQLIGINSAELNRKNVRIFSITGQEVNYRITGANAIALDENAPSGLYILKLKNQQIKLIKE